MSLLKNILNYSFSKKEQENWADTASKAMVSHNNVNSSYNGFEYPFLHEEIWDGEKTQGEIGAPIKYLPDYNTLSYRSWKAYTDSDLAQIVVKAHVNWVIGGGLNLQAEPNDYIINSEGFDFDKKSFIKNTESRFRVLVKQNESTHSKMMSYNMAQRLAYLNAIVGGDVLVILRVENGIPTIELVDGIHIENPDLEIIEKAEGKGNEIIHGIELDKQKKHIRFYYRDKKNNSITIEAFGKTTGREMAFLIYGIEYRIDSVRGMPLLSSVLEKITKLDRYNEAIVASAEEAAKVPWFFEHKEFSTGENPDLSKLSSAIQGTELAADDKIVDMTKQTSLIKKTYQKTPYNLPVGASLKRLEAAMEKDQEAFVTGNFIFLCAAMEIPYEVALMRYVNSFSSSRMASQSFLFILNIKRMIFNESFNNKYYKLFLDTQILSSNIIADGYLTAQNSKDVILMGAYTNSRFTGTGVPQADPFKEVKAEVEKMKNNITTRERVMEVLDGNLDFYNTIDKISEESEYMNDKLPQPEVEEDK